MSELSALPGRVHDESPPSLLPRIERGHAPVGFGLLGRLPVHLQREERMRQAQLLAQYGGRKLRTVEQRLAAIKEIERSPFNELTRQPRTVNYAAELATRNRELPIRRPEARKQILEALDHRVVILVSGTGTGKSTEVPPLVLLDELGRHNEEPPTIACTQPRRVTAQKIATRVAENLDSMLSEVVGVQYHNVHNVLPWTSIRYRTDGSLLGEVVNDAGALARKYQVVIIDEAHERTLDTEVLLALIKEELLREGSTLRLIIMSATLSADRFRHYFAPLSPKVLTLEGASPYRIDTTFADQDPSTPQEMDEMTIARLRHLVGQSVDTLVFVSGRPHMGRLAARVRELLHELGTTKNIPSRLYELYSQLSKTAQDEVVDSWKAQPKRVRVILATNVAETGLTLPGVGGLIDTGKFKLAEYRHGEQAAGLPEYSISHASYEQRRGRVGRTGPRAGVAGVHRGQAPAVPAHGLRQHHPLRSQPDRAPHSRGMAGSRGQAYGLHAPSQRGRGR